MSSLWDSISTADELRSFEALPAGVYSVTISECESSEDKAGNPYVKCEYTIIEGDCKNRKIWDNMYLRNDMYPNLEQRGKSKIKRISDIKGVVLRGPSDLKNFIGMELFIKVNQYKNKNDEIKNDVQDIRAPSASEPVAAPALKKASPFG
jgi:hypothetical protein